MVNPSATPPQRPDPGRPATAGGARPPLVSLSYEAGDTLPTGTRRPAWVYAILGVYALLLLLLASSPWWLPILLDFTGESQPVIFMMIVVGVMMVCQAALLLVPVRQAAGRPLTRRSIWVPLIASGILAGLLAFAAGLAFITYAEGDHGDALIMLALYVVPGSVWLLWCVIFGLAAFRAGPGRIGAHLHHWLLAGSVLELAVAVPMHIAVRRRNECCAHYITATAICIGAAVAIVAFGPSVALLYLQRWRRIRPR